jgi:hypothetical protein
MLEIVDVRTGRLFFITWDADVCYYIPHIFLTEMFTKLLDAESKQ